MFYAPAMSEKELPSPQAQRVGEVGGGRRVIGQVGCRGRVLPLEAVDELAQPGLRLRGAAGLVEGRRVSSPNPGVEVPPVSTSAALLRPGRARGQEKEAVSGPLRAQMCGGDERIRTAE